MFRAKCFGERFGIKGECMDRKGRDYSPFDGKGEGRPMDDSMDDLGTRWSGFGDELLETEGRWIGKAIPLFRTCRGQATILEDAEVA